MALIVLGDDGSYTPMPTAFTSAERAIESVCFEHAFAARKSKLSRRQIFLVWRRLVSLFPAANVCSKEPRLIEHSAPVNAVGIGVSERLLPRTIWATLV